MNTLPLPVELWLFALMIGLSFIALDVFGEFLDEVLPPT